MALKKVEYEYQLILHMRMSELWMDSKIESTFSRGGDRRYLAQPGGRCALQPGEAWRPRRTDDRPVDRDAEGRRGGGPRRHRPGGGRIRVHWRLNSEPW